MNIRNEEEKMPGPAAAVSLRSIVCAPLTRVQWIAGGLFFALLLVKVCVKAGDFTVYYAAGTRFLAGMSVHVLESSIFTYPTFAAMLMGLLSLPGYGLAKLVFFLLSFLGLVAGVRIINHYVLPDGRHGKIVFWLSLLICMRYIWSIFEYQQTDLLIFGLVLVGLHCYQQNRTVSGGFWAVAALLKANPLFLLVLPVLQQRWRVAALLVGLVAAGIIAPDVLKPAPAENTPASVTLPTVIVEKAGRENHREYRLEPLQDSYLEEYIGITFDNPSPWWQHTGNPMNQSLSIIPARLLPGLGFNSTLVFLGWCMLFSLLLAWQVRKGRSVFELGILCYTAFVLIGPMASKYHFIAFYGIWVMTLSRAWPALVSRSLVTWVFIVAVTILFGFTSKGIWGDFAVDLQHFGNIGLSGLALWLYCLFSPAGTDGESVRDPGRTGS